MANNHYNVVNADKYNKNSNTGSVFTTNVKHYQDIFKTEPPVATSCGL